MKRWSAQLQKISGVRYIAVRIPKEPAYIERIKRIEGRRWHKDLKVWLIPDTPENRDRFEIPREKILSLWHQEGIDEFQQWLQSKRYSRNTVKVYIDALKVFLKFHNDIATEDFEEKHLIQFNNEYILALKLSASWQNQAVNSIKLYFSRKQTTRMAPELMHRPKQEHKLPHILSKEEVKQIINSQDNIKHRMVLSVIYACGLRRGELQRLELAHIDRSRMTIFIRQAKGKKDRIVPLSPMLLSELALYYKQYRPKKYLFEGQKPGEPYSDRTMTLILKHALDKTGIQKPVTLHWLRHSYATHLLDKGTDIRFIQELLGHNSTKTTEIYTHVSQRSLQQIISPFDEL
jgi:integrase/recombinase XerD